MFSQLTKLLVVLFLASTISYSRFQFAHAQHDDDELDVEAEDWDEGEDFDEDESADPWDNTGDYKPMDDALPSSVFAVIHLSQESITSSPGLMEFVQYDLPNYPKLSARDVKQSPAKLRFFASEDAVTLYTISEALENDAVPEEQLAEVEKIEMPPREALLKMVIDEVDLSDLDAEEIQGILADHNVLREDIAVDDDLDPLDEDEEILGEDGEPVAKKPRRRKKRTDWRKRRADRLKREEAEAKEKRKEEGAAGGVPGVGLAIPGPILFLIVIGGLGGMGYLGFLLMKTQEASLDAEERKKRKSEKKMEKRLKKEAAKIKKKR